jgi:sulfoxide reductase catalytic subunit YedY
MLIQVPEPWRRRESEVTPESAFQDRRRFLRLIGLGAAGLAAGGVAGWLQQSAADDSPIKPQRVSDFQKSLFPARKNADYAPLDASGKAAALSPEGEATSFNNFYEFSTDKREVSRLVGDFITDPWTIKVHGLCNKPQTFGLDELLKTVGVEERIYRFRCVEAWAMVVPWTGFPLHKLLSLVDPKPEARYLRFVTFKDEEMAPGFKRYDWYPWPYFEGLRMDEARHELTLLSCGVYGKPMPRQNGAPLRLVVPWKYGFKSIKSIVEIELVAEQPKTFWNTLEAEEYGFFANVNPEVPHPRWSQASERMLGSGDRRKTELLNGYAREVKHLYSAAELASR